MREFALVPGRFQTRCGGLFLFLPDLVRLHLDTVATTARLAGSKMIPATHALRACLALKLWSIERKSHVMALVADQGLALFTGLNVIPKKSYLSEYASRISHPQTTRLMAAFGQQIAGEELLPGRSFNLDFHSVPYHGEHPVVERHYVSMRSRRQSSILTFLAQDADGHAFCYAIADLRKGEEAEEVLRFVAFWEKNHGERPRHLVFDSQLTTYEFRQLFIQDLGHDEPTILLTNDQRATSPALITRYAQRMLIENALSDAVRFFHMNALSSAVGLKVDFDMALLVIASGLYRLLARKMRGYADAQARSIFRDLVDIPATVEVSATGVQVHFHRRAHLPIIIASGLLDSPVRIPWWNNLPLTMTAHG